MPVLLIDLWKGIHDMKVPEDWMDETSCDLTDAARRGLAIRRLLQRRPHDAVKVEFVGNARIGAIAKREGDRAPDVSVAAGERHEIAGYLPCSLGNLSGRAGSDHASVAFRTDGRASAEVEAAVGMQIERARDRGANDEKPPCHLPTMLRAEVSAFTGMKLPVFQ